MDPVAGYGRPRVVSAGITSTAADGFRTGRLISTRRLPSTAEIRKKRSRASVLHTAQPKVAWA